MRSIKTKLILVTSLLIVILLSLTAFSLIKEKEKELTHDIFINARNFGELSVGNIVDNYEKYLKAGSGFVLFNRDINAVFLKNQDLKDISIYAYDGETLYDSVTEKEKQFSGAKRLNTDPLISSRLKAKNPSILIADTNQIIYLKKDSDGNYSFVDANETAIEGIKNDEKISDIIFPYADKYAVKYGITYDFLFQRIKNTQERIVYLALFGILIGMLFSYIFASGITGPLAKLKESVAIIAKGNFAERVQIKSSDEVGELAKSVNKMAGDLEKSTAALIDKERMAKELELAAQIQKNILPKVLPKVKNLDIAAGLIPATEIGGDCYDFIAQDENLLSYVGDVTGHGVPSGLVVSIANALIFSYSSEKDIKEILIKSNTILKAKTQASMFLTMLMSYWNSAKNELHYVSAGHEQPIIYKSKEQKVIVLDKGGIALGMVEDISKLIKEEKVSLDKGDVVIIYTDGIPEAWANEKENYGMARFKRAVSDFANLKTAEEIKNAIIKDVQKFMGKYYQKDDITIVVMKRI